MIIAVTEDLQDIAKETLHRLANQDPVDGDDVVQQGSWCGGRIEVSPDVFEFSRRADQGQHFFLRLTKNQLKMLAAGSFATVEVKVV